MKTLFKKIVGWINWVEAFIRKYRGILLVIFCCQFLLSLEDLVSVTDGVAKQISYFPTPGTEERGALEKIEAAINKVADQLSWR
ncbi:MAG: hypothetical protein ACN6NV_08565 [Acinetobacter gandensis]|uniref:hypothetical protein n=1 Tax=Acinetobacter gandensis TaxID=1443941 RepID=UPI003D03F053